MDRMCTFLQSLWNWQCILVYPPAYFDIQQVPYEPYIFGLPSTNITLTTKDGVELDCYLIKNYKEEDVKRSRGTVIMFHGNAMFKSSLLPYAFNAYTANFNVLAVEYRGYAGNKGRPSEEGLQLDAQAALDYVLADPILSTKPVIAFGQSMGGAVAIDLTSRNVSKISALIVENTFTSIPDLLSGRLPWFLKFIRYFCTEKWNSRRKIITLPSSLPILMFSGLLDTVVPASNMQRLWDAAKARHVPAGRGESIKRLRKHSETETDIREQETRDELFTFEYGGHVDTHGQRGYSAAFRAFLRKVQ